MIFLVFILGLLLTINYKLDIAKPDYIYGYPPIDRR